MLPCLWKTEHDRSPSCGRLPAGRTRRAASRLSQGLSDSNLGRDLTLGYEDDRMRGGGREGITLYDTSRLVSGQSRREQYKE